MPLSMIEKLNLELKQTRLANDKLQNLVTDQFLEIKALKKTVSILKSNLEDVVNAVERICEYSAALPPKKLKGEKLSSGRLRISQPHPDPQYRYTNSINSFPKYDFKIIDLYELEEYVQENISTFSLAVHLTYSSPDSLHAKYMISKQALHSMPISVIINQLLPETSRNLLNYLKEKNK